VREVYPYSSDRAAHQARRLLRTASRVLGTVDPSGPVTGLLDGALPLPPGDPRYGAVHAFEPRYSETAAGALQFAVEVPENGPAGSGGVATASQEVRRILGDTLGRKAVLWFDRSSDAARSTATGDDSATVVSAFDRDGFREAEVTYLWGPWFTEGLPDPARQVAETVVQILPGAQPAFTTIRAARQCGSQAMSFRLSAPLPLAALGPLMAQLGLAQHQQSLTTAVAFALGATYVLPADAAMVTIRPMRQGLELRLDIDLEQVPNLPPDIADLIALELSERPRSLHALEQWVAAFSPDGDETPGSLSVLSVTVRPDMPARLSLYVRPHLTQGEMPRQVGPMAGAGVPGGPGVFVGARGAMPEGLVRTAGWR